MKAGIVTITNGYNYGNRLQNYAVQEALESRKIQAETIWKTTNVFDKTFLTLSFNKRREQNPEFSQI